MANSAKKTSAICRKTRRSNCRLCSYLCGVTATIENGRIVKLAPDPTRYPYDASVVLGCRRFHSNLEFLDHPQRVNYPLKRVGPRGSDQWVRLDWNQALDEIADRLTELKGLFGPETLATSIGGPHTTFWPLHRFMNLFGSPNNLGIGQICWNPSIWVNSLTFGWPIENEIDAERTCCAILWGVNPAESDNSIFWRSVQNYSRTGRKLIVIDPRRTRTAAPADHWLAPRPGTDSALALGFLHVIIRENLYDAPFVKRWCHGFDLLSFHVSPYTPAHVEHITGIPAADIERVARCYATLGPATIFHGRGIDQIGPNSLQTHRALACLKAITGNIDRPGAALLSEMPEFVPEIDLELTDRLPQQQRAKQLGNDRLQLQTYAGYERLTECTSQHGKRLPARYLTSAQPNLVWRAMLEGKPYPIRSMVVSGSNPLLSQADAGLIYRALKNLDLLVVLDLFRNPTAMLADYILPMAGSLERPVLQTNAGVANIAYGGPAAIDPLYERRCDFDFWRGLGIRMGQEADWPWQTFTESLDTVVAPLGLSWKDFCQTGLYSPPPEYRKHEMESDGAPRGFATPSGKIELYSELLSELDSSPLPSYVAIETRNNTYPLILITGGRKQPFWASSFRQLESLRKPRQTPQAEINAETAAVLGLADGESVKVTTPHGTATFTLKIIEMRSWVVNVDYGWWYPEQQTTDPHLGGMWLSNANLLTSAGFEDCDPLLGQWTYNGIPCRVEAIESRGATDGQEKENDNTLVAAEPVSGCPFQGSHQPIPGA